MTESVTSDRSVSVVIPVRNEAANIEACIESILSQSVRTREIVVVDSRSTDGTTDLLKKFSQVRVITIEPESFNHGEARNIGVREANTEWVVLTVGDARAADNFWIEKLFAGVLDSDVAGVCGSQIVPRRPDTNPVDWFNPIVESNTRRFQFASAREFDLLTPAQQKEACSWDDVTALYRRDVLVNLPFEPVMYGEDAIWAKAALRNGHALVYNASAKVHHYHNETAEFTFRRTILTLCLRYRTFGFTHDEPQVIGAMVHAMRRLAGERELSWRERASWLQYNLRNQLAARAAVRTFHHALEGGDNGVENLYRRYATVPPVPMKARSSQNGIATA
jgi:rhamnosyltransferase